MSRGGSDKAMKEEEEEEEEEREKERERDKSGRREVARGSRRCSYSG